MLRPAGLRTGRPIRPSGCWPPYRLAPSARALLMLRPGGLRTGWPIRRTRAASGAVLRTRRIGSRAEPRLVPRSAHRVARSAGDRAALRNAIDEVRFDRPLGRPADRKQQRGVRGRGHLLWADNAENRPLRRELAV